MMVTTVVMVMIMVMVMVMVMGTWLTAGPPTVVQASPRATKGKRRSRERGRAITGMVKRRGSSLAKNRRFNN